MTQETIRQTLTDAGCAQETIASFAVSAVVTWLGLPICLKTYRKKR